MAAKYRSRGARLPGEGRLLPVRLARGRDFQVKSEANSFVNRAMAQASPW